MTTKQDLVENMSDTLIERFKVLLKKNREEDALSIIPHINTPFLTPSPQITSSL